MPILNEGDIMVHPATRTIGQVVDTIYPPNNKLEKFIQVLQLADGTRREFRLVELTTPSPGAVERFCQQAKIPQAVEA